MAARRWRRNHLRRPDRYGAFLEGIAASAIADVLCIAFFVWHARRRGIGLAGLGFAHPPPKYLIAGLLIGCSAWYVNLLVVTLLHVPEGPTELLKGLLQETGIVQTIAAIAILPALAEEIVFRGVLARALANQKRLSSRSSSRRRSLASITCCRHRSSRRSCLVASCPCSRCALDSIVPAVVAHFLNNAIAIIVSREEMSAVTDVMGAHPVALLGITVGMLTRAWSSSSRKGMCGVSESKLKFTTLALRRTMASDNDELQPTRPAANHGLWHRGPHAQRARARALGAAR